MDLIGDPKTRRILAALNVERQSVKEIAERLDLSQPTVYRRINELEEHDLIEKHTIVGADGSHYTLYECKFVGTIVYLQGMHYEVETIRDGSNSTKMADVMKVIRELIT